MALGEGADLRGQEPAPLLRLRVAQVPLHDVAQLHHRPPAAPSRPRHRARLGPRTASEGNGGELLAGACAASDGEGRRGDGDAKAGEERRGGWERIEEIRKREER